MRIISGAKRGHTLHAPAGLTTRPTSDKVRQALFNILGDATDLTVLDLYAGTGALALEALSRGARRGVCVEQNGEAWRALSKNVEALGFSDRVTLLRLPVLKALPLLAKQQQKFDWILIDPPYQCSDLTTLLPALLDAELLAEAGIIVLEHDTATQAQAAAQLIEYDSRRYGRTILSFYSRPIDQGADSR